jgi:hypothetical protein
MSEHAYSAFCLRYFPNLVTGEFMNVGVALVTRQGAWTVRIADELRDARCLFPAAQPKALRSILEQLRERLGGSAVPSLILEPASADDPLGVIRRRIGTLHGSLQWSEPVFEGTTGDLESELTYWFSQLVQAADSDHQLGTAAGQSRNGPKLRVLMEQEFVRRGVRMRLRPRRIEGYFPRKFEYTYQNGALSIFEPIHLRFKSPEPILRSAQQWRGLLDVMHDQVQGPLSFYALVDLPDAPNLRADVEAALTMVQRAQVDHVETVPVQELERFGELVAAAVGDRADRE